MTTMVETKNQVFSQLVREDSIFVNPFLLDGFEHMQKVLGGDCIAIALPIDIIFWYSAAATQDPYKHTMTIRYYGKTEHVYGNVLITSNDDDNVNGIRSLSPCQLKWLIDNVYFVRSELHGNYVLKFFVSE